VDKGWFRERPQIEAPPDLAVILSTAREIATAMAFLHDLDIVHGDLTGGGSSCLPLRLQSSMVFKAVMLPEVNGSVPLFSTC
jgi:serine/threonine protein kinase